MSTLKSITAVNNDLLYLVQGTDKLGRDAFYYLLVDKLKKQMFLKHQTDPNLDLRHYGKILISDFGLEPTEDAKMFLKNEYGLETK